MEDNRHPLLHREGAFLRPSALRSPMHRSHSAITLFHAQSQRSQSPTRPINSLIRQQSVYANLIDDRGGGYEEYRKSDEELKRLPRCVRKFYQQQNEQLDAFAEVDGVLDATVVDPMFDIERTPLLPRRNVEDDAKEDAASTKIKWAINVNLAINVILLAAKLWAVLLSNSISLVASTVDSAMDLLATIIIAGTAFWVAKRDWKSDYHYPIGKDKLEPLGIIIFSVFMEASFIQVLIESVTRISRPEDVPIDIPPIGLIIMWATIGVKLILWFWCRTFENSSVRALAQDAQNDIVFNLFSILFPWLGAMLRNNKLDPLGGIVLSSYIIVDWLQTLYEHVIKLAGRRASSQEHNRVVYLMTRFSPVIRAIQHVSVYHCGDPTIVEADVIVPSTTSLRLSHNLGESVQMAIESLPNVARAYVHVDFQANPATGHKQRK